ncbi:hypothetical protein EYF80_058960 [Liparis tanakae]|uniref:Secreted protein n=1 Tax=Liparis tanakae TaxID=230148 RepID=A0A4Z2EPY9_9TELE|nr:hypothetical protein EYF80_058960 [Liparis tanakae]
MFVVLLAHRVDLFLAARVFPCGRVALHNNHESLSRKWLSSVPNGHTEDKRLPSREHGAGGGAGCREGEPWAGGTRDEPRVRLTVTRSLQTWRRELQKSK